MGLLIVSTHVRPMGLPGTQRVKLLPIAASDVIGYVTIELLICGFLLVASFNQPSISHGFWDIKLQRYWGHDVTLTFWVTWRHRSSDHWTRNFQFPIGSQYDMNRPLDSQYGVSYRWSLWTDCLPSTVFEILSFKDIRTSESHENQRSRLPHCRLTPRLQGTPREYPHKMP